MSIMALLIIGVFYKNSDVWSIGIMIYLFITDESAYNLIRKSVNVIGFNSTVLIESIILGHKPILPLFNEATNKYKNQVL